MCGSADATPVRHLARHGSEVAAVTQNMAMGVDDALIRHVDGATCALRRRSGRCR